jgi:hypothetical protein
MLLCFTVLPLGCTGGSARFIPAAKDARSALDTALKAWQSGQTFGAISEAKPVINLFDARWKAGKKLDEFEILDEIPASEQKQFKVRLKLKDQLEETDTYVVVGIDPLNVFRDADYQRPAGM